MADASERADANENARKKLPKRWLCSEKGCMELISYSCFCALHEGECVVEGCLNRKHYKNGGCCRHPDGNDEQHQSFYEWVKRLVRDRALRRKWIKTLYNEQQGRCAQSVMTCQVIDDGQATSVCPWGDRLLPLEAAQVDHIKPLGEGGSNKKNNLQVLCACCHAIKSHAEARQRAGRGPGQALPMDQD